MSDQLKKTAEDKLNPIGSTAAGAGLLALVSLVMHPLLSKNPTATSYALAAAGGAAIGAPVGYAASKIDWSAAKPTASKADQQIAKVKAMFDNFIQNPAKSIGLTLGAGAAGTGLGALSSVWTPADTVHNFLLRRGILDNKSGTKRPVLAGISNIFTSPLHKQIRMAQIADPNRGPLFNVIRANQMTGSDFTTPGGITNKPIYRKIGRRMTGNGLASALTAALLLAASDGK